MKQSLIPDRQINFNPEIQTANGYFTCPECGNQFYDNDEAMHKSHCSLSGYKDCTYHFGTEEIKTIQSLFDNFGFEILHGCWGHLKILRDFCKIENQAERLEEYKNQSSKFKSSEEVADYCAALIEFLHVEK